MGQKTQAELEEEAAKAAREKNNMLQSVWDFINPFKHIGTILTIGLVALGGYLLLGGGKISEMLGGLMDKIPEWIGKISPEWGEKVKGWMSDLGAVMGAKGKLGEALEKRDATEAREKIDGKVPPAVLNVITKDDKTWKDFVKTTKDANGGTLTNPEDLTNANSIVALVTKQPALVKSLLATLKPAGNKELTTQEKEALKPYLATALEIVKGPKFDELLNNANRKNTLELLLSIEPKMAKDAASLEAQLKMVNLIDADGKPSQKLRDLLSKAITEGKMPDTNAIIADVTKSVDVAKDPSKAKLLVDMAEPKIATAVGTANVKNFRDTIGDVKIIAFASVEKKDQEAFVMKPENLPAFKAFADTANITAMPKDLQPQMKRLRAMPQDALHGVINNGVPLSKLEAIFTQPNKTVPDASFVMTQLQDSTVRKTILAAGIENVAKLMAASAPQYASMLTKSNLITMYNVAKHLDEAASTPKERQLSHTVFAACVELANDNTKPFEKLTPEQIKTFFANTGNNNAMRELLNGFSGLKGQDAVEIAALKHQWGKDASQGIGEVLANVDGAKYMKEKILSQKEPGWAERNFSDGAKKLYLKVFGDDIISENREFLVAYQREIENGTAVTSNLPAKNKNQLASNGK